MSTSSNEMEIIIPEGCGNAPRKQIVIDFTLALFNEEIEVIREYADESVVWHQLKEGKTIEGRDALIADVRENIRTDINRIEIFQVITHGKFASINGLVSFAGSSTVDFCEVVTFSNAAKSGKVKEIRSYRLDTHR